MNYIINAFNDINFGGRISRRDYAIQSLFLVLILCLITYFLWPITHKLYYSSQLFKDLNDAANASYAYNSYDKIDRIGDFLYLIPLLMVLPIILSLIVRRLHDINISSFSLFLYLPITVIIWFISFLFLQWGVFFLPGLLFSITLWIHFWLIFFGFLAIRKGSTGENKYGDAQD